MSAEPGNEAQRWNDELHRTKQGEARDALVNVAIILRTDARFAGRLRWNDMLEAVEGRDLPWRPGGGWREWTDTDDLQATSWCQERHVYVKPKTVAAAVQVVARDRVVHPVRDYLGSLEWDDGKRLGRWLFDYLGVRVTRHEGESEEDARARELYLQKAGRCWMISAVARVMQPGCKVDHAVIFESGQGRLKSSTIAALVPDRAWYADQIADLGTKDSSQDIRGKWIIELGELSAMKRSEVERVKAFMSRAVDHYRPSYGMRSQDFPRQCTFAGTTNEDAYLADHTGNRRFWPVKVGTVDLERLRRDRDQLWAEAVAAYRAGERWWLDEETERAAASEQAERRIEDPWESAVLAWAERTAEKATVGAALKTLGVPQERQDQTAQNRVARIFRAHQWERHRFRDQDGILRWGYRRVPTAKPEAADGSQSDVEVGTEKLSDINAVPTVPPSSDTHAHTHTRNNFANPVGTSGNWEQPLPWTDGRGWRDRYKSARTLAEMQAVVLAWVRAADGVVLDGKQPTVKLPGWLPNGPPLSSLREMASDTGIRIEP